MGGDQDSAPSSNKAWCVVVEGFGDEKVLQSNIDYACSHQVDCGPIQPSGSCFLPNTLTSHASFAMNSYWRLNGQTPQNCDFDGSGTITSDDPSYGDCHYL
ncbi:hypothetical protein Dsin_019755 [Dipteronia sinensis]|uniref:X8 domain-containing protein n=1 Tax=Dipteronia sinensis TaxID=43782 RepID=A0AAE0E4B4_9ROSI|nr:hypothetical protein Dsin_019755 [Dipteronia sinensis]